MQIFSREIQDFLKSYNENYELIVSQIPKSKGSIHLGDVLLFRYDLRQENKGSNFRIVLVTRPVIKEPGTGNLLLTGVKVYPPMQIGPLELEDLYKNRAILPEDNFRTYRLNRMQGPLIRILNTGKT